MPFTICNRPAIGVYDNSNNGYNHENSLTYYLGYLLNEVENRYLSRDMTWTILGITFSNSGPPQTWFPATGRHVIIVLSSVASYNANAAISELSHEVIHLLDPNGRGIFLEEGLATLFTEDMAKILDFTPPDRGRYAPACDAVEELLKFAPTAIRDMRTADLNFFSKATPSNISRVVPGIDPQLAQRLAAVLPRA